MVDPNRSNIQDICVNIEELPFGGQGIHEELDDLTRSEPELDDDEVTNQIIECLEEDGEDDEDAIELLRPDTYKPIDELRHKVSEALSEVNIAYDAIGLLGTGKYLACQPFKHTGDEQATTAVGSTKSDAELSSERYYILQGLKSASAILREGHRRMMRAINASSNLGPGCNFHLKLLEIRQKWLFRKLGNHFVGDLAYSHEKTLVPSQFEIIRPTMMSAMDRSSKKALELYIPAHLQVSRPCRVVVAVTLDSYREKFELMKQNYVGNRSDTMMTYSSYHATSNVCGNRRESESREDFKLRCAQTVVFCEDLMRGIFRENSIGNFDSCGELRADMLEIMVMPGVYLKIQLVKDAEPVFHPVEKPVSGPIFWLELYLYTIMVRYLEHNTFYESELTASAMHGVGLCRQMAGVNSATINELKLMVTEPKLLEELCKITCHFAYRHWLSEILDDMSNLVDCVKVLYHLNSASGFDNCSYRVAMVSPDYENVNWNRFIVSIHGSEICIERPYHVLNFGDDMWAFRQRFEDEVADHITTTLTKLAESLGFNCTGRSFRRKSHEQCLQRDIYSPPFRADEVNSHVMMFNPRQSSSPIRVYLNIFLPTYRTMATVQLGLKRWVSKISTGERWIRDISKEHINLRNFASPGSSIFASFEQLLSKLDVADLATKAIFHHDAGIHT